MSVSEDMAGLAVVVGTLVGAPLTVMILYLKAIRDQQATRLVECARRVEGLEAALRRVADEVCDVQRDAATKEEWIRENMWLRGKIERLSAALARFELDRDSLSPVLGAIRETCQLMSLIESRLATGEQQDTQENK